MRIPHLALATAASVAATTSWAASVASTAAESTVPERISSLIGKDMAILAYKSVSDGNAGKTTAIVVRNPAQPDPELEDRYEDRTNYVCELILFHEKSDQVKITGRSSTAVDCDWNQFNRRAEILGLNDALELSSRKVTYVNDNPWGGSNSYSFEFSDSAWRLSGATVYYKDYSDSADEVLVAKEEASYPKDFGVIPIDKFDPHDIADALHKNKSMVP